MGPIIHPNTNHKSQVPTKTIVITVPKRNIERIKLMTDAYIKDLPSELQDVLKSVYSQLEASRVD
jgi:hypothetical protein